MKSPDSIYIVIPAFKEATVIGAVIAGVLKKYKNIIVIDDCSPDETAAIARQAGAIVLSHPINLGQGAALATGIKYALGRGAEYIVTFDADGQHRVEDIEVLLRKQLETNAEMVIGSRFLGSAEGMPPLRRFVLKMAVHYTRLTSGVSMTDAHNGFRLLTRSAAQRLRIRQNRMSHASEIIDQIRSKQISLAEAPITVLYTEYSLQKGQRLSNAFNIIWETILARMQK